MSRRASVSVMAAGASRESSSRQAIEVESAYGRATALAVRGITPELRRELLRQRAQLTPVERRRRPRVVSLQTIGTTPAFVVATAMIADGGVTTYRLRVTLQWGTGQDRIEDVGQRLEDVRRGEHAQGPGSADFGVNRP